MAPRRTPKSAAILSDPTAAPHIPLITRTCGCRLERAPPLNRCRHPTAAGTVMPFDATRRPFDKLRCTSISEREAPLRPAASPARRHGKRRASTRVPLFRKHQPDGSSRNCDCEGAISEPSRAHGPETVRAIASTPCDPGWRCPVLAGPGRLLRSFISELPASAKSPARVFLATPAFPRKFRWQTIVS